MTIEFSNESVSKIVGFSNDEFVPIDVLKTKNLQFKISDEIASDNSIDGQANTSYNSMWEVLRSPIKLLGKNKERVVSLDQIIDKTQRRKV